MIPAAGSNVSVPASATTVSRRCSVISRNAKKTQLQVEVMESRIALSGLGPPDYQFKPQGTNGDGNTVAFLSSEVIKNGGNVSEHAHVAPGARAAEIQGLLGH